MVISQSHNWLVSSFGFDLSHFNLPFHNPAYMYGEAPFADLCHDPLQRLAWWKVRAKDSNGSILSVRVSVSQCLQHQLKIMCQMLGVKLFSVSPSEMCDERLASQLTVFNSAKRNGLSAENLIHMAQLHDHWTYGLDTPKSTHTAALHLPRLKPSCVHLPTPTLQDLMNLCQ